MSKWHAAAVGMPWAATCRLDKQRPFGAKGTEQVTAAPSGGHSTRHAPVMVPYTTVPFFSSICTFSFDSFIRNLRGGRGKSRRSGPALTRRRRAAAAAGAADGSGHPAPLSNIDGLPFCVAGGAGTHLTSFTIADAVFQRPVGASRASRSSRSRPRAVRSAGRLLRGLAPRAVARVSLCVACSSWEV